MSIGNIKPVYEKQPNCYSVELNNREQEVLCCYNAGQYQW